MFGWLRGLVAMAAAYFRPTPPMLPSINVASLPGSYPVTRYKWDDGEKFIGGFGSTDLLTADYWTLRARSTQLFETNLYARGIIRRLVTNEINTGLHLEATPEEAVLGVEEDSLSEWSENIENRFRIWGKNPWLCDHQERRTFGALQAQIRLEALVAGDVLVVLRQDRRTGLPRVQLISGSAVQTPMRAPRRGHRILHGVELDPRDRHVGFWVTQRDGISKRLPAFGEKSGRRIAWLVYGTERRLDAVRGKPLLSLILQSLREIDRYRDSVQRKATINSMLAMFIRKTEERMGTRPLGGGAVVAGTLIDKTADEPQRTYNVAEFIPGLILDELQVGEEPQGFSNNGTDEKFGDFEEAIVAGVAWALEIPPEILRLAFSNNYSASAAAINEFKIYLNAMRTRFGDEVTQHVYVDWLLSEALLGKVEVPGLLEAWRDPSQYDLFGAWISACWAGQIKPSTDVFKQARGYEMLIENGLITRARAAREMTGMKFSKIVQQLARENAALAEALEPLEEDEGPDDSAEASALEQETRTADQLEDEEDERAA